MNKIRAIVRIGVKNEFSIKGIYLEGVDIWSRINAGRVLRCTAP
jgi:hypothetical protein